MNRADKHSMDMTRLAAGSSQIRLKRHETVNVIMAIFHDSAPRPLFDGTITLSRMPSKSEQLNPFDHWKC